MPIPRLKQLQTPEWKNNSELYRTPASVHTAPYILIPLECHITTNNWTMDLGLARFVPSPRPGPRRLTIYLPVPSSAVTLSRRVDPSSTWYGRQLREGCFVLSRRCPVVPSVFRQTLSFEFPVFRFVFVYFMICLLFEVVILKFMVIVF